MHEMGEMKEKPRETHETMQKLTSQLKSMQEQMHFLSDSGEFQEVESNHSGRSSYVSSLFAVIPSSRSMLSRDKRFLLTHGTHRDHTETFLVINFLRLIHPEIMKVVEYEYFDAGGVSVEFYGWTAKTANIGTAIRQIP